VPERVRRAAQADTAAAVAVPQMAALPPARAPEAYRTDTPSSMAALRAHSVNRPS
jgi:hypothetical protein